MQFSSYDMLLLWVFNYSDLLSYIWTPWKHFSPSGSRHRGSKKKICDFRKCFCRAVSSQPLQTRSCLLHSTLRHFLPLFIARPCAPFPKPKLSGSELTTVLPSAVPWERDVVLHGYNQTTLCLEQKERLTLYAELSVQKEKSGQHGLPGFRSNYTIAYKNTPLHCPVFT